MGCYWSFFSFSWEESWNWCLWECALGTALGTAYGNAIETGDAGNHDAGNAGTGNYAVSTDYAGDAPETAYSKNSISTYDGNEAGSIADENDSFTGVAGWE